MELTIEQIYALCKGLDNLIKIQEYEQRNFKPEFTDELFTEEVQKEGKLISTTREITMLQELKQTLSSGKNGIYIISKDLTKLLKGINL